MLSLWLQVNALEGVTVESLEGVAVEALEGS